MWRVPISRAYPIRLIRWMIRRVQLLEIRKHTCRVSVIKMKDTKRVFLQITLAVKKTKNMKQKNYIIKLLLKTWLGILCFSLLCTFCAVWLLFQNTKQSSYDNINIVYEGIFLTWAIIGVIMFSVGTFTLFLNYFPVIRYNNIYSFLSFFLVPMLLILLCGTEILCLWTVKIPFIVCLSGAYLLFRNKIKNTANNAG